MKHTRYELFVFGMSWVQISDRTPSILTDVYRGPNQLLQVSVAIEPQNSSRPFPFTYFRIHKTIQPFKVLYISYAVVKASIKPKNQKIYRSIVYFLFYINKWSTTVRELYTYEWRCV